MKFTVDSHLAVAQRNPVLQKPANRQGKNMVFLLQDPCRERGFVSVGQYRNSTLNYDRTVIQCCRYKMHGTAVQSDALINGSLVSIDPGKCRKK